MTGISPRVAAATVTTCASTPGFGGFGRNRCTSIRATSASTITANTIRPRRESFGCVDVTSLMPTSENCGCPTRPGCVDSTDRNDDAGEVYPTMALFLEHCSVGIFQFVTTSADVTPRYTLGRF